MMNEGAASNPFESPRADLDGPRPVPPPSSGMPPSPYAPCPRCGRRAAVALKFTWWGGLLGPKLFTHVQCAACGKTYNGKTGGANTANIVIYQVVTLAVVLVVMVLGMLILLG